MVDVSMVYIVLPGTSETTTHNLLEKWITCWSETTKSTLYHNTLFNVRMVLSHQIISMVPIGTAHMSLRLWFVQFCQEGTRETTTHTLLANWVTGRSETITSTLFHHTLYHVGMVFSHQIIPVCVSRVSLSASVCITSTFSPGQYKWDHCTHLTWKLGH